MNDLGPLVGAGLRGRQPLASLGHPAAQHRGLAGAKGLRLAGLGLGWALKPSSLGSSNHSEAPTSLSALSVQTGHDRRPGQGLPAAAGWLCPGLCLSPGTLGAPLFTPFSPVDGAPAKAATCPPCFSCRSRGSGRTLLGKRTRSTPWSCPRYLSGPRLQSTPLYGILHAPPPPQKKLPLTWGP